MPITQVNVNQLLVSPAGHFFRANAQLDDAAVERLFKTIKNEWAKGRPLAHDVREHRIANGATYTYSFLCINMKPTEPPFLPGVGLKESRYGFILLLEVDGLMGLFKRGPTGFETWIDSVCDPIQRDQFTRVFDADASYEKISLRRMAVSKQELLACSYEAADLATTIPALGLGRSIPRFLRLRYKRVGEKPLTISITPATSRITKSGKRLPVDDLVQVVSEIAQQVAKVQQPGFLDAFPLPIDLTSLPATIQPTAILFDFSEMSASAHGDGDHVFLKRKDGGERDVTNEIKHWFAEVLSLTPQNTNLGFGNLGRLNYGLLRRNVRSYSAKFLTPLDLIVRDENGVETPFESWVRQRHSFSVCFTSPEYFYTQGQLYRRTNFSRQVELVKSILDDRTELDDAESEKGETELYDVNTAQFDPESIFFFVENSLCNRSTHLWCCDLGDEWADYITVTPRRGGGDIQFLHCKHGDITSGGSAFQEVVGQALKNLGRVQVSPRELDEKIASLAQTPRWAGTAIPRYRGPGNFAADAEVVVSSPDVKRTVLLVVTMLSKRRFRDEAAKAQPEPYFIQLVWLLASFINSCREMGARASIVCRR